MYHGVCSAIMLSDSCTVSHCIHGLHMTVSSQFLLRSNRVCVCVPPHVPPHAPGATSDDEMDEDLAAPTAPNSLLHTVLSLQYVPQKVGQANVVLTAAVQFSATLLGLPLLPPVLHTYNKRSHQHRAPAPHVQPTPNTNG